jgi:PAS domain S-box-containing protein
MKRIKQTLTLRMVTIVTLSLVILLPIKSLKKAIKIPFRITTILNILIITFIVYSNAWAQSKTEQVIVGVLENWPPQYSFDSQMNKPTGFAIDIFEEVARQADIEYQYRVFNSWPELNLAFKKKEVHIIPNMGITSERQNLFNFTVSYETFHIHTFVRQSSTSINSTEDLKNVPVGVVKDNKGLHLMKTREHPHLQAYSSLEQAVLGLLSGEVDALVYPDPPLKKLIQKSKLEEKIRAIGKPLFEVKRAIGVYKDDPELFSKLNLTLSEFIKTESYQKIYSKWFGKPTPYWTVKRVLIYAVISIVFIFLILLIMHYRSISKVNRELRTQVSCRTEAEESLKQLNKELEQRVKERTIELEKEIIEHKKDEKELYEKEKFLQILTNSIPSPVFYKDDKGIYTGCNKAFEDFLGKHKNEIVGKTAYELSPNDLAKIYEEKDLELMERRGVQIYETAVEYADKSRHEVMFHKATFTMPDGKLGGLIGVILDITDRKKAEEQIKASLKEKETLLQEIHHRVKNNMTVISSLLNLQMKSTDNKLAKEALQDSQNRVQSMSMIHETLYRSDNLSDIDLKTYLLELGRNVIQNYSFSKKVQFRVEAESIMISVKQASPVGLIVNELITNSLKYAFTNDKEGEILLELKSNNENGVELTISDNGVGIPEGFDLKTADSLGLKLVKMLVENQLDGSVDMESNNGTKFRIKFNIDN